MADRALHDRMDSSRRAERLTRPNCSADCGSTKLLLSDVRSTSDYCQNGFTMAKTVFYSFHYSRDVHRVQLVRNINALEGQPLLNSQEWESVRTRGAAAIERWIDEQMKWKKAVIVLVGQQTSGRKWIDYEINKAWDSKKPLLGVRIHGLASLSGGADSAGSSPFNTRAGIPLFDPTVKDGYGRIDTKATYRKLCSNLESWSSQGATRS